MPAGDGRLAWDTEPAGPAPFGGHPGLPRLAWNPWVALADVAWPAGNLLGEPDTGIIGEDGPADFSLIHGDPLTDPTTLWRVWRVAQPPESIIVDSYPPPNWG
jgi:hypothetical protein